MAIPALDEHGLLPAGVHDASLDEVAQRFGRFTGTDRRVQLHGALVQFAAEARQTGRVAALVVDGSFITGKPQPEDIDLIVVLHEQADFATEFRPDEYNVLSARRVRSRYPFDVRYATAEPEALQPLVDFFAQVRGRPELRKGMVRVTL